MKKFLVLMMVLGMATMANAALQISVNGDTDPTDSEYTLTPSQELILDVWTNAVIAGTSQYFALVVDFSIGNIDYTTGWVVTPDNGGGIFLEHAMNAVDLGFPLPPGWNGIGGGAGDVESPDTPAGAVLFDGIVFHCIDPLHDAVIRLYSSPDGTILNLDDTAVIHQIIPEPMTMALLGLGGLFLRRRK